MTSAGEVRRRDDVSVVIPNYNQTRYLIGAIRSALTQRRPPLEVIVVDDGSTDHCRDAVAEFGDAVRYVCQPNQGLGAARNTGILAARGEFVGLLDADDQWTPDFLETMLRLAEQQPAATVYYCAAQAIDEEDRPLPQVLGGPPVPPAAIHDKLLRANFLIPSTILMRRSPVVAAGLFERLPSQGCEDWDLWLRLLPVHTFAGHSACLTRYRIHQANMSGDSTGMQRSAMAVMANRFGPDDGAWATWTAQKRRAYGGLYRYLALTSVQRRDDWHAAETYLGRALTVDPSIGADLDLFYDLALGSQPAGYRGTTHELAFDANARRIERMLESLATGTGFNGIRPAAQTSMATACHALGLVAYNTGHHSRSRTFLLQALQRRPALVRDRVVLGDLLKSVVRSAFGGRRTDDDHVQHACD